MKTIFHVTSSRTLRLLIVVGFLIVYAYVTIHISRIQQQNCLSAQEVATHMRRLEKLEQEHSPAANETNFVLNFLHHGGNSRVTGPPGPVVAINSRDEPRPAEDKIATVTKPTMFVHDRMPVQSLLNNSYAPNTVYYIWCGQRWFEFPHYVSVLSVIHHLRPDNIVFLYDILPVVDSWTYNTWFGELSERFAFFRSQKLAPNEPGCSAYSKPNMDFVNNLLTARGGMYINEMTIVSNFPLRYRLYDIVNALDAKTGTGLIMTKRGFPGAEGLLKNTRAKSKTFDCVDAAQFSDTQRAPQCLYQTKALYPKNIWELDNSFGRLVRTLFYGAPEIKQAKPTYDELIPNIAHIVWLGGGAMDFLFYLCVNSLVHVAKVDMVYIHGDGPPTGPYWDLVKHEPKVQLIYREPPIRVYGTPVNVLSHVTDIWRVDFMIKYGGIYVDTDVVFVRPLTREIRGYEAVGSYDWTDWNPPFPDTINFGVAIGKRNAPYWHKFQESMKWFMDEDWSWNGLRQPYRIQERHPDLVRIDPHLQVICYLALCHPTWWPNYHNESIHHLNSPSITDWRKDVFAFHWTLPTPYELKNHTTLLTTNSIFSEIGKYVLEQAGVSDHFVRLVQEEKRLSR